MATQPAPDVAARAFELMKELVAITGEKWVGATRFTAMTDRWGLRDPTARVTFLTGVKELMRNMPVKVFEDPDVRQSILSAVQDALDEAIDQEEAEQE